MFSLVADMLTCGSNMCVLFLILSFHFRKVILFDVIVLYKKSHGTWQDVGFLYCGCM